MLIIPGLQENVAPPTLTVVTLGGPSNDLTWGLQAVKLRKTYYERYGRYYDGNHDLLFATEKFRNAFGNLFRKFADNLCPVVVNAVADRLVVTGFDGSEATKAQDLWDDNKLPRTSGQVHRDGLRDGDTYVIVWPDSTGTVRIWPQSATACAVEYDDETPGKITKGVKVWARRDGKIRLNLYYADRIERYITRQSHQGSLPMEGNAFVFFSGDLLGATIPNPYGRVPMFHFGNDASVGQFGRSELADIIPVQDALNKSICDMLVAMEFMAFPQRWATGLEVEVDEDSGKPRNPPFTPGQDRVWTAAGDVRFGQFPAADLDNYIKVQDGFRMEMARISGTPFHYMGVQQSAPSGESLKTTEGRLVKKTEDRQLQYGDTWRDVMDFACDIEYGVSEPDIRLIWATASPHNPLLDAEVQMVKQQLGVSTQQSLRELGYSEEKITEMMREMADDAAARFDAQQRQQALLGAIVPRGLDGKGGPAATGSNGKNVPTTEGGKIPLPPPKPRVSPNKDWQNA